VSDDLQDMLRAVVTGKPVIRDNEPPPLPPKRERIKFYRCADCEHFVPCPPPSEGGIGTCRINGDGVSRVFMSSDGFTCVPLWPYAPRPCNDYKGEATCLY